jgi:hypothetical protein
MKCFSFSFATLLVVVYRQVAECTVRYEYVARFWLLLGIILLKNTNIE